MWYAAVTPLAHLVYVVFHPYLGIFYIGHTHVAPTQRLRKHLIDAVVGLITLMATIEQTN